MKNNEIKIENEANLPLPCRCCLAIADFSRKLCGDCIVEVNDTIKTLEAIRAIHRFFIPKLNDNHLIVLKSVQPTSRNFVTVIGESNQQTLNIINELRGLLE